MHSLWKSRLPTSQKKRKRKIFFRLHKKNLCVMCKKNIIVWVDVYKRMLKSNFWFTRDKLFLLSYVTYHLHKSKLILFCCIVIMNILLLVTLYFQIAYPSSYKLYDENANLLYHTKFRSTFSDVESCCVWFSKLVQKEGSKINVSMSKLLQKFWYRMKVN